MPLVLISGWRLPACLWDERLKQFARVMRIIARRSRLSSPVRNSCNPGRRSRGQSSFSGAR